MPTATAHNGSEIYVETTGSGPAILLPYNPKPEGDLADRLAAITDGIRSGLADKYTTVLFDYPGTAKPSTLTPDNVVADLLAVANAVGAQRFGWYGYSWTAVIGMQLAVRTDRLTALVMGGFPPLGGPYREMLAVSEHLASGRASDDSGVPEGQREAMRKLAEGAQQFVTFYEAMQGFDDRAAQSKLKCPRLAFAGSEDRAELAGVKISLADGLLDHRDELESFGWDVRVLDGYNHQTAMQPDIFVPLLREWLDAKLAADG